MENFDERCMHVRENDGEEFYKEKFLQFLIFHELIVSDYTKVQRECHFEEATLIKSDINLIKNKAFPLQTWTGLCGSRRLRLRNFQRVGT
jgi:hypothetical protein